MCRLLQEGNMTLAMVKEPDIWRLQINLQFYTLMFYLLLEPPPLGFIGSA